MIEDEVGQSDLTEQERYEKSPALPRFDGTSSQDEGVARTMR